MIMNKAQFIIENTVRFGNDKFNESAVTNIELTQGLPTEDDKAKAIQVLADAGITGTLSETDPDNVLLVATTDADRAVEVLNNATIECAICTE
jgi:hypothetical protein